MLQGSKSAQEVAELMQRLAAAEKSGGEAQTQMSQLQIRAEEGERKLKDLTQQRQVGRVGVGRGQCSGQHALWRQ